MSGGFLFTTKQTQLLSTCCDAVRRRGIRSEMSAAVTSQACGRQFAVVSVEGPFATS